MSEDGERAGATSSNAPILVCFALREEARFFKPPEAPPTDVLVTGMGARAATSALERRLARTPVRAVLACGFAGGLNPDHPLGRVLYVLR